MEITVTRFNISLVYITISNALLSCFLSFVSYGFPDGCKLSRQKNCVLLQN